MRYCTKSLQLMDVCKGLIYLHPKGFVHGDLKGVCAPPPSLSPSRLHLIRQDNVLVDDENRARLTDFGLAGISIHSGLLGASISSDVGGTAAYMAPELVAHQVSEDRSNVRLPKEPVDVYALGMLMYEVRSRVVYDDGKTLIPLQVLCGEQPFHGSLKPHGAIRFSTVKGTRPELPSWLSIPDHPIWNTVKLCWSQEPEKRPQLSEILDSLISACRDPPAEWSLPPSADSTPSNTHSSRIKSTVPVTTLPRPAAAISQLLSPLSPARLPRVRTFP